MVDTHAVQEIIPQSRIRSKLPSSFHDGSHLSVFNNRNDIKSQCNRSTLTRCCRTLMGFMYLSSSMVVDQILGLRDDYCCPVLLCQCIQISLRDTYTPGQNKHREPLFLTRRHSHPYSAQGARLRSPSRCRSLQTERCWLLGWSCEVSMGSPFMANMQSGVLR